ncbi:MAG: metallophosphoesterase, partial [Deltaproteobacteria bacterium]|nr:metallophosphoesterase [Deltaproteobacteria bacterium]
YRDYVGNLVAYYRNEPAILMWQLVNEAESKDINNVPDSPSLYNFASDMSDYIRSLDPNHLINLGTMGTGQPGISGDDYEAIHALPNIDLLEVHDYNREEEALPGSPLRADIRIRLYLQDEAWRWRNGTTLRPGIRTWNPYTFTIPSDITFPLKRIGLDLRNDGGWPGTLYADQITIGSQHSYSFEGTTVSPWESDGGAISSINLSQNQFYEGLSSLAINLTGSSTGKVRIPNPADVAPGDVMTAYLYAPDSAEIYNKNSIAYAFHVARGLNKPIFVGESGIRANCTGCYTEARRAALFDAKIAAVRDEGGDGYLLWEYVNDNDRNGVSEFDFSGRDPVMDTLVKYSPDTSQVPAIASVSASVSDNGATITWNTDQPATSQVEYGLNTLYGVRTAETATNTTSHSVTLTGLGWNRTYHYRVRSKGSAGIFGRSGDFSFTTSAPPSVTTVVTAFGDHGDTVTSRSINQSAADEKPAVHLLAGDWHYHSTETAAQSWWDNTFLPLRNSQATLLFALGNHEETPSSTFNRNLVGMAERWFSRQVGGIYFIVLDSNLSSDAAQRSFLERELQAAQGSNWQVVVLHQPPFSASLGDTGHAGIRSRWSPLFDQYGVDLVVTGHHHHYGRSDNVCYDQSLQSHCPVYVVTGGGGKSLYNFASGAPAWNLVRDDVFHYLRLEFATNELHLAAVRNDGALVDSARVVANPAVSTYIATGAIWDYFKGTTDPPQGWNETGFDDPSWLSGATGIGYGDSDDATVLSDMQDNYVTVYARKTFNLAGTGSAMHLLIDYDDSFVAYLNGTEVARRNISATGTSLNHQTTADGSHEAGTAELIDLSRHTSLLNVGANVLAVEIHNGSLGSSDLSFIPSLTGNGTASQ